MIKLIAKKDFLLNLTSARFILGFLICLIVIPFTLIVSIDKYKGQIDFYETNSEKAEIKLKNNKVYSYVRPEINSKPEALSIFNEGIQDNLGSHVEIQLGEYPLFLSGQTGTLDNPLLNRFSSIDFCTVISIILSLFALVFSYDTFSHEREIGTMKMILINKLSRTSFFLGKLSGILLTILPIMAFCYLLSILFIILSPSIAFTGSDWIGILLLFVSSVVYVVIFILLGMFISSMVRQSSTAIIISLLVWIWFLFLIPGIASYSAKSFVKIGLYDNIQFAFNDMEYSLFKEYIEKNDETLKILKSSSISNWNVNSENDAKIINYGGNYTTGDYYSIIYPWLIQRFIDYADKKWPIQKDYYDGLVRQEKVQQYLATLSPSEIFLQLSSSLCHSNAEAHLNYMEGIRKYRETVIKYFEDKKIFESSLWFTPHGLENYLSNEEYQEKMKLYENCKTDEEFKLFYKSLPKEWNPENYQALNLDDFPRFDSKNKGYSMNVALSRFAFLLFIGLILLGATMLRFQRYQL